MNKMNDPIENAVDGFRAGLADARNDSAEYKEETARLKFWGVVLVVSIIIGCAVIYSL